MATRTVPPYPPHTGSLTWNLFPDLPCEVLQIIGNKHVNGKGGIRYILNTSMTKPDWLPMSADENWQETKPVLEALKLNYFYYRRKFPDALVGTFSTYSFSGDVSDEYLLAKKFKLPHTSEPEVIELDLDDLPSQKRYRSPSPDSRLFKRPRNREPTQLLQTQLPDDDAAEEVLNLEGPNDNADEESLDDDLLQAILAAVPESVEEPSPKNLSRLLVERMAQQSDISTQGVRTVTEYDRRMDIPKEPKKFSLKKTVVQKPVIATPVRRQTSEQQAATALASMVPHTTPSRSNNRNFPRVQNAQDLSTLLVTPPAPRPVRRESPPTPTFVQPPRPTPSALSRPVTPLRAPALVPPTLAAQQAIQVPSPLLKYIVQTSRVTRTAPPPTTSRLQNVNRPQTHIFHNTLYSAPPPTGNRPLPVNNVPIPRYVQQVPPAPYKPAPVQPRNLSSQEILNQLGGLPQNSQDLNNLLLGQQQTSFTMDPGPVLNFDEVDDEPLFPPLSVVSKPVSNAVPVNNKMSEADFMEMMELQHAMNTSSQVFLRTDNEEEEEEAPVAQGVQEFVSMVQNSQGFDYW